MNSKGMYRVVVVAAVLMLCSMFAGRASAEPVSQHVTVTGYISCTTCLMPSDGLGAWLLWGDGLDSRFRSVLDPSRAWVGSTPQCWPLH